MLHCSLKLLILRQSSKCCPFLLQHWFPAPRGFRQGPQAGSHDGSGEGNLVLFLLLSFSFSPTGFHRQIGPGRVQTQCPTMGLEWGVWVCLLGLAFHSPRLVSNTKMVQKGPTNKVPQWAWRWGRVWLLLRCCLFSRMGFQRQRVQKRSRHKVPQWVWRGRVSNGSFCVLLSVPFCPPWRWKPVGENDHIQT